MEREFILISAIFLFLLALIPHASARTCGVYIYDLDANKNGVISFRINNTGDISEDISYSVYVGLNEIKRVKDLSLDAGKSSEGLAGYSFLYGNYWIRVEASADCGSQDYEEMVYAILKPLPKVCFSPSGVEGDLRCDEDAGFVLECRDGKWIYYGEDESCRRRCHPYCEGEKIIPECRVDIDSLDFLDRIIEGRAFKLEAAIRNSGTESEVINLKLFINGVLQRDYLLPELEPGNSSRQTLYYFPKAGENDFRLEAIANCSASDSKEGSFLAIKVREPEPEPEPEPVPLVTSVRISRKSLDIPRCRSETLEVEIESSRKQEFTITVTGAEEEWLQYPKILEVEGREKAYIYITPQKLGRYNLTVTVQGESRTFREVVGIYVVPEQAPEEEAGDWFSGLARFIFQNFVIIMGILAVVIIVLVVAFGTRYWSEKGRI